MIAVFRFIINVSIESVKSRVVICGCLTGKQGIVTSTEMHILNSQVEHGHCKEMMEMQKHMKGE